jgi:hypothetical protein
MKKYVLAFLVILPYLPLSGSGNSLPEYDTLRLIKGSRIILPGGHKIKIEKDTTVTIHNQLDYRVKYPRGEAGDIFFDTLETRASRSRWTRELHNIVITSPGQPDYTDTLQTRLSSDPFLPYGGRYIRDIHYTKLEPFGPSLRDTSGLPSTNIEQFGNDLHRLTQDRVLKNHLLLREGELVDPNKLADNERIIRKLPFIEDARIYILEDSIASDSVDILVLTKDNFSIGLGGELLDYNAGRLNIFEKNLFGLGHELHLIFHWDGERSPWLGNEILYRINNLGGSFINSHLRYAQIFDSESYLFGLDRRFFTPDVKWAGAMNLERTRADRLVFYADSADEVFRVKYNIFDLWAGRSFHIPSGRTLTRNRLNFVIASRIFRNHYIDRPEVTDNSLYEFHNRNMWLTSFSVLSQAFFKSNLIFDFGRTEDIPYGMRFTVTMGPEMNEFNSRWYTGFSLSQGRYIGKVGYLYTRFEGGGFLRDDLYFQQGVINTEINYFSPLIIINRFKFRHFVNARYVRGIRRFEDEFIGINDLEGIRGFRSSLPLGQQKTILNYEINAFTPYYLYGFRFVIFGFADAGIVGPEYKKWHDGEFFSGLGVGVRIRNERLVFETITLRLGYYANHPEKSFPLFLDVYGEQRLNPDNFFVTKPDIIGFE